MRPGLLALLLVVAATWAPPVGAAPEVDEQLRALHRQRNNFGDRLTAVSRLFVGAPFRSSPLGEGPGRLPDSDPLMDLRHFDCLTYVEQVMAFSWQGDLGRARQELQRIRYAGGEIRYGARNHIMMAQWIPNNIAAGYVRDVTRAVAGDRTRVATLTVRASDFERGPGARLRLAPTDRPVGRHAVPIVPLGRLHGLSDRIPHGTVVTVVRTARPGVPYRASHVALVVVVHGERRVRHAAAPAGAVIDESFPQFLARTRRLRKWPVAGLNLLAVADRPPGRMAQAGP